ncbi:MAG: winged helix-turn-helix domain-containing protein [Candidatus Bathyarchaeia archaeon]
MVEDEVEKGLGSPVKLRILRALASGEALTMYELLKKIPTKPTTLRRHLKDLVEIGWVEEQQYATVKKYRMNSGKKALKHLIALFREVSISTD